jgi:integrase
MPGKPTHTVPDNHLAVTARVKNAIAAIEKARDKGQSLAQREWHVEGVAGLSIVVKPSGAALWVLRYQVGKGTSRTRRSQSLGSHEVLKQPDGLSLAGAKVAAFDVLSKIAKGADPVAEEKAAAAAMTLRELFDDRLAKDTRRAPRTLEDYKAILESDVFPELGDLPANQITDDQIAEILERIETRSKHAAHKARSALGSTFRWGQQRGKLKKNPVKGLGFTHQSKPRERILSDAELRKIWSAIDADAGSEAMRLVLKLAILTGQRNSEVAGAEISELELDVANPKWRIPSARMKRKSRDQIVPLSQQAVALFRRAIEIAKDKGGRFVFPGETHGRREGHVWRAEHLAQESVSRAWARVRERAGVKDVNLHDMRKCITTWLRENKHVSTEICDHILHHGQKGVTSTHYDFSTLDGPVRQALGWWADHVEAVASGDGATNVRRLRA